MEPFVTSSPHKLLLEVGMDDSTAGALIFVGIVAVVFVLMDVYTSRNDED